MDNLFFSHPILNSPYEYPSRHWELDKDGQPTQQIIERRRSAEFITPIPKPKKQKRSAATQMSLVLDEGKGLSTSKQQYDPTGTINLVRGYVDAWRMIPDPNDWKVTPETARLLQHWRGYPFTSIRPFFCQVEKVEVNEEAWVPLNNDVSRPFEKPKSDRIAVKAIHHLGDEVMKVLKVT